MFRFRSISLHLSGRRYSLRSFPNFIASVPSFDTVNDKLSQGIKIAQSGIISVNDKILNAGVNYVADLEKKIIQAGMTNTDITVSFTVGIATVSIYKTVLHNRDHVVPVNDDKTVSVSVSVSVSDPQE